MEQRNLWNYDHLYLEALDDIADTSDINMNAEKQTLASNSTDTGHERRGELRTPHKAVLVMPYGECVTSAFEHATLVDCSLHGIGLTLVRPLRPGIHLFLKLKLTTVALVVYSVKYCRPCEEGYRIGADFRGVIGTEEDRASSADEIFKALLATE